MEWSHKVDSWHGMKSDFELFVARRFLHKLFGLNQILFFSKSSTSSESENHKNQLYHIDQELFPHGSSKSVVMLNSCGSLRVLLVFISVLVIYSPYVCTDYTIMILSFRTNRSGQTVYTQCHS